MRHDIGKREVEIRKWVDEYIPKAEIARRLDCRIATLDGWLKRLDIEYRGNMGGRGYKNDPSYIPAVEYSMKRTVKPYQLKLKLLREGIKEHMCEECGVTEWLGKPVPLEMDHIDGNRYHNAIDNLRMLCCNCHALTETYCRKTKKVKKD